MYCLVPVNWNLLGEEVGKGTSKWEIRVWGWYLFYSNRCQWKIPVQIHWPIEHLEISVVFRWSKHGELCSVVCICFVCFIYIYVHISFVDISMFVYISVCLYLICVCVECKIHCLPHSIKLFILRARKLQEILLRHVTRKQSRNYCWRAVMYTWISWWTIWRIWRKWRERYAKNPE